MPVKQILSATSTLMSCATLAAPAFAQDQAPNGEIIVTATKRQQTLQDVPIAVSVTTAETIEQAQIRDLLDLQSVVPSLRVSQLQSSANTDFIIRGFGNGANNPGIEPSVGVFIDGVYRSRSAAQVGDLPNVQRIEILRGPQSTLFGKNASAGVISIVTEKPQYDFGGGAEFTYGSFNTVIAKANITGPISENVAFSLAGNINKRDGYARDLNLNQDVNDRNRWGLRGDLLIEPSDNLSIRLIADYDKIDENCCVATNIVNGPTGPLVDILSGGVGIVAEDPFSYSIYNNYLSSNDIENYGVSGQVDYNFGDLNLTSISAYRRVRLDANQDVDWSSADLIGEQRDTTPIDTFSQELRLTSNFDGPLNFLLGGYYFNENIDQTNTLTGGTTFRLYIDSLLSAVTEGALDVPTLEQAFGLLDGVDYSNQFFAPGQGYDEAYDYKNEAISVFGTVDYNVTDRFTITGGLNYTSDDKSIQTNVVSSDVFSAIDFDAVQYAPFRNQLLRGGALAEGFTSAEAQAFADANDNDPAANPLAGLRGFQFLPPFLNLPNQVEDGKSSDSNLSWTLKGAYEVSDNLNVYATYATGFKASSFNLTRDSRPLATDLAALTTAGLTTTNLTTGTRFADPEEARVIEVGLKGKFDKGAFNVAVFDQEIKGFQSNVFTGTGFILANAGKQSTFGVEFDGTFNPIEALSLFYSATYLNPKYDSFINSSFGDISGQTPAGIPEFSTSVGGSYAHEMQNGMSLTGRVDYQYESSTPIVDGLLDTPDVNAANFEREVNLLNASLTLQLDRGLQFAVYGRNIGNTEYLTSIFPTTAQSGSVSGYPNQPRTYGATVRYKF